MLKQACDDGRYMEKRLLWFIRLREHEQSLHQTVAHSRGLQAVQKLGEYYSGNSASETTVVSLDEVKRGKLPHEDY